MSVCVCQRVLLTHTSPDRLMIMLDQCQTQTTAAGALKGNILCTQAFFWPLVLLLQSMVIYPIQPDLRNVIFFNVFMLRFKQLGLQIHSNFKIQQNMSLQSG